MSNPSSSSILYVFICFLGTLACHSYQNDPARKEAVKPDVEIFARKLPPKTKPIEVPETALNLKNTGNICYLMEEAVKGFHKSYLQGVHLETLAPCATTEQGASHFDFRLERLTDHLDFRLYIKPSETKSETDPEHQVSLLGLTETGEEIPWDFNQQRILSSNVCHLEPSLTAFLEKALKNAN